MRGSAIAASLGLALACAACASAFSVPGGSAARRSGGTASAARRAPFGSLPPPSSSPSSLDMSASAAAIYGSGTDEIDSKPFRPGPYVTFGSSGLKLNWFGALYGGIGIALGLVWYTAMTLLQVFYWATRDKIDTNRRIPILVAKCWSRVTMALTRCNARVLGKENLKKAIKKDEEGKTKAIMFVANHCSWMDIPFIGANLGTRNYKVVSKVDLLKVPILGKSLRVAKHIILDRSSRRSQLNTYKSGVAMMKAGVNLVTFAEGTRSRTGRLGPFKAGAFKMAESVDADIVPVAISYAHRVQPLDYVFPVRMSRRMPATISFGEPISTEGKTDAAVIEEVWDSIARQLPESQKPLEGTPKSIK